MDPLDDEDIVLSQLFRGPRIPPLPGLEVKNRQIDFFSLQERLHVFIKLFYIDSFQTFKIIISIRILRCVLPIHKIIVHRDRMRFQSIDPELNGQPV